MGQQPELLVPLIQELLAITSLKNGGAVLATCKRLSETLGMEIDLLNQVVKPCLAHQLITFGMPCHIVEVRMQTITWEKVEKKCLLIDKLLSGKGRMQEWEEEEGKRRKRR